MNQRAEQMLQELEADPHGCGSMEIEQMLEACNITERLSGEDVPGYRMVGHARGGFPIYYPRELSLPPAVIRGICRAVRRLDDHLGGL